MRSPLFRWRAATERDERDMVFFDDADKPVGYGEIEGWWSSDGEKEIHGIQHDLTVKLGILRYPQCHVDSDQPWQGRGGGQHPLVGRTTRRRSRGAVQSS